MSSPSRRTAFRLGGAAIAVVLTLTSGGATAAPDDPDADDVARVLSSGQQVAPKSSGKARGVDPFRGLVTDPAKVDYVAWARQLNANSAERNVGATKIPTSSKQARAVAAEDEALFYQEREPTGVRGSNDRIANAERIAGVGTGDTDNNRAYVLGRMSPQARPASATTIPPKAEDDGSIPLAADPGVSATRRAAQIAGIVGDGPHGVAPGDATGDFDVFKVTLTRGQELTADSIATAIQPGLDGYLALYDATGEIVAINDDRVGSLNPLLTFRSEAGGTYYLFQTGYRPGGPLPSDPFDSGSGPGLSDTGSYQLTLSTRLTDVDFYRVDAEVGDTVGLSLSEGATVIGIYEASGELVHGSNQDASSLYPPNSPLPGGGNAVAAATARATGPLYFAVLSGDGFYTVDVAMYRPGPEHRTEGKMQTIFLDFDGETVNTAIWGGPGVRRLSPLSVFLANWDLSSDDENALIDRIIRTTRENIQRDLDELNPDLKVRIRNSRDHPDNFGSKNVTRVIVGGSIEESGINTIGIAQYIDPGNYGTEDSAVVLLDLLSEAAGPTYSLNTYITEDSNKIKFIGVAIGNVTAHEAGHMIGNYHVDQFNELASIMDQGGNFPLLYGVGEDDVGGTADDPDVDFNKDEYNPNEGFSGLEATDVRSAWAHSQGRGLTPVAL